MADRQAANHCEKFEEEASQKYSFERRLLHIKLKKILAVALAATTALSSGVAYDMLGASAKVEAANSGNFYSVGDTFTVTESNFTYTYKVLKPIWNGYVSSSDISGKERANNALYDNGEIVDAYEFANTKSVDAADGTRV